MQDRPILAVVMDPLSMIHPKKDTTVALLLKAQSLGWSLQYLTLQDLSLKYGSAWGRARPLEVFDLQQGWFALGEARDAPLSQFDVILMRKDPPVDLEYLYATYILEQAEANGSLVINKPQSLRDANEKLYAHSFPQCMPPTLVSASIIQLKNFIHEQETAVIKPLHGMGGKSVFKCSAHDPNLNVILETLTQYGNNYAIVQQFIPEIVEGDKRILLIDGEPIPYALARIPQNGDFRANLAVGGVGECVELTDRDYWICAQVGPQLREKGLFFVGLDVIGEYLTEINVTSPTCVRELEAECDIDISGRIMDTIMKKLEV